MRYQSNRPRRQFLAGVKCPTCGEVDKVVQIQTFEPEFDEYIECTACGYTERRPTPEDLPAIANATQIQYPEKGEIQPIKFLP